AAIFLNNGKPFQVGERLAQHELAETLREISKRGTDGFYRGWVGAAIVASNQAGKGLLTQEDLDNYKVRELAPVECDYRGYHVVSAPPPSSGGVVICEVLNILEGYPLKELGYHSAQAV
ncbi:gamma-glutamyltransferase, partial [Pseudomonas aeruginosa]|uniref:gamma-glutamyltransferase n=5 Tax=Pseudomonadota TaxID=1224 RepID=UPI001F34CC93